MPRRWRAPGGFPNGLDSRPFGNYEYVMSVRFRPRLIRGVLAALLSLLFVLTPMIDSYLCGGEESPALALATGGGDEGNQAPVSDNHAICPHGHCHHLVSMNAELPRVHLNPIPGSPKVAWLTTHLASNYHFSLERPPRA